jgi:hypothetical protein
MTSAIKAALHQLQVNFFVINQDSWSSVSFVHYLPKCIGAIWTTSYHAYINGLFVMLGPLKHEHIKKVRLSNVPRYQKEHVLKGSVSSHLVILINLLRRRHNDTDNGNQKYLENDLSQWHFVCRKCHVDYSEIKPVLRDESRHGTTVDLWCIKQEYERQTSSQVQQTLEPIAVNCFYTKWNTHFSDEIQGSSDKSPFPPNTPTVKS